MMPSSLRSATYWATGVSLAAHVVLGAALVADNVEDLSSGPVAEKAVIQLEMVSWARSAGATDAASIPAIESKPETSRSEPNGRQGDTALDVSPTSDAGESGSIGSDGAAVEASAADVSAFQQRLLAHIARHRFYPQDGRSARPTGVVMVQFMIAADGSVSDVWVYRGGGDARLDRAAVATVERAQPMPRPPAGMSDPLKVLLPVDFADQGGASAAGSL